MTSTANRNQMQVRFTSNCNNINVQTTANCNHINVQSTEIYNQVIFIHMVIQLLVKQNCNEGENDSKYF